MPWRFSCTPVVPNAMGRLSKLAEAHGMSELAVGIDLGTTNSVIAVLDSTGRPKTIQNSEGDATTPSVVFFDTLSVVVGREAVKAACLEPECIAEFAKREIGYSTFSKPINGQQIPPEVIESFVLEKLKRDAEAKVGPFRKVIITVPAYFNEPRRKATQDAGHLAGLEVIDIINEPTAAAIAFGMQQGFLTGHGVTKEPEKILVYDLGGGTFDVTLMDIKSNSYTALATDGDVYLGGLDWSRRLADFAADAFQSEFRFDPKDHPGAIQRLMLSADETKHALTARDETRIVFEHSGHGVRIPISRMMFEKITSDLLERTRLTVRNVLREGGLQWPDITRVLLVGGATRMPMVKRMLEEESGKIPDTTLSPDEAVAHGAALYAGLLMEFGPLFEQSVIVRNVNSHDLGVLGVDPTTGRPRRRVMIPRNTPLPLTRTKKFQTRRDNQDSVAVRIVEGGDDAGQNATLIGTCALRQLPPGLPAGTEVDVSFSYEQNGRLKVRASLPRTGRAAGVTLERSSGLSEALRQEWYEMRSQGKGPLKLN